MTKDKLEHHLKALQEKHKRLDKQVKDAYIDNRSDLEIEALKKKKLKIKDEIEECKRKIEAL